jgi:biopolymer transport protein ExbD
MLRERARGRRRGIALTSLIDVIFILLLFFLLTSTFARFGEVRLTTASAGTGAGAPPPVFLRLTPDAVSVNGVPQPLSALPDALAALDPGASATLPVLVAMDDAVSAQRLLDLVSVLRGLPRAALTVVD